MPNWCSNKTTITGRTDEITRMMRDATVTDDHGGQEVRLAALMPMPEILHGTTSPTPEGEFDSSKYDEWVNDPENEYWDAEKVDEVRIKHEKAVALAARAKAETGYSNWWDWQLDNWGIKWGDGEDILEQVDEGVLLTYETPWGPFSDEFFENLTNLYDVHIENLYDEPGMCFTGGSRHQGGRTIKSLYKQYPDIDFDFDEDDGWAKFCEMRDNLVDEVEAELWSTDHVASA